ncbi:gamma-glutamylcyclotransferase isoform X2 [Latimeria chalumnae]|uniref:gamma-glutamylcyclotransferase isoform X2 n=1 Tax=Latimeria chalumnae TaxID=7897 RepID=UPI00313F3896
MDSDIADLPTLPCQRASTLPWRLYLCRNYRLAFGNHKGRLNTRWHGGVATIVESPGEKVWGVVWKLNVLDLPSLDKQESVDTGFYNPIEVTVSTEMGEELICRSYEMNDCVLCLPSPHYKQVICLGAKQDNLPHEYQRKLEAIGTNDFAGPLKVMEEIEATLKQ